MLSAGLGRGSARPGIASHREAVRSLSSMIDVALIHHIIHAAQIRISEVKCRVLLIYTLLRFISEAKSWVLDFSSVL